MNNINLNKFAIRLVYNYDRHIPLTAAFDFYVCDDFSRLRKLWNVTETHNFSNTYILLTSGFKENTASKTSCFSFRISNLSDGVVSIKCDFSFNVNKL